MNREQLEKLEEEVNTELYSLAKSQESPHDPITDGIVNIDLYLSSSPKILWILKEPWERLTEGEAGGDWSITKYLGGGGKIGNTGTWARMAYVCYAVFNAYVDYSAIRYATDDPMVQDSLKNIAYINVKKFPGKSRSNPTEIASYRHKYRDLLNRQISAINPDVIIAGNILHLFYEEFCLNRDDLTSAGSLEYCCRKQRLYINAYHPGYWRCNEPTYVNDLVAVIKKYYPTLQTAA